VNAHGRLVFGFILNSTLHRLLAPRDWGGVGIAPQNVLAIDAFTPFYSVELKLARAAELAVRGVKVANLSCCDKVSMQTLLTTHNASVVLHLAAQPGVRYALSHPDSYVRENLVCFVQLLEAIRHAAPLAHLVFASSSSVYGANTKALIPSPVLRTSTTRSSRCRRLSGRCRGRCRLRRATESTSQ